MGGVGATATSTGAGAGGGSGRSIPASYFGLHINKPASYPIEIPFGQFRGWDSGGGAQWPSIETCQASSGDPSDACFVWQKLDAELANLKAIGIDDVFYTLSRTPPWAVTTAQAADANCNYYNEGPAMHGACYPPIDLNADGTGENRIWRNWITAIATRVNDSSYRQTHAHVHVWEPWNEFYRSTILSNWGGELSFQGTYAQIVRLTEDARCIVTGKGTIHNVPSAGSSTPCTAPPIDPDALVSAPSSAANTGAGRNVMRNFLYCDGSPKAGSECTTGNAGSDAIDLLNYHLYASNTTPEVVSTVHIPAATSFLQGADATKPLVNGEGSWGDVTKPNDIWLDAYARAGFIARFFALYWSAGVTQNYWYSYDTSTGQLFNPQTRMLDQPEAMAWKVTQNWLVGAVPSSSPFCSAAGTTYHCDFTRNDGTPASLVWDYQYGQTCLSMPNPIVCGATTYAVPAQFHTSWFDLTGTSHAAASTVQIGANPILLQ